ncbi:MAG: hypothetical protein MRY76_05035 [Pseudomonadales bacterium]|nr:hypothetical protein [Pseudomonadales bacterium]
MNRWQAFALHFGISVLVFLLLLAIILVFWYPGILFSIDGGWTGLRIVIAVDLVLGPLLTLIVFKPGKPGLKFDLTCIGLFQAVCLSAGMWIVWNERPVALVLAYDTLYSLAAGDFENYGKDPALLDAFPGSFPKLLYTELPENDISADIVSIRSQFIGDPLFMQTERYRPMPAEELASVYRRQQATRAEISDATRAGLGDDCLFSRFVSPVQVGYVCLDAESRKLSGFFVDGYLQEQIEQEAESGSQ